MSNLHSEMTLFLVFMFLTVLESLPADVTCSKLADIYWNSSNPMFRIDNTDHIIDVNKNNVPYEYDQVNIICPAYPHGAHEDDAEKYIIYNVSKDEYDMCTITGANPRIIAICDKPHRVMYFTVTFRPFTPQPGGLEFRPGQDYYFISTSSKDDFFSRIGGKCLTHNMRVVFKVCCNPSVKSSTPWTTTTAGPLQTTHAPPQQPPFVPGFHRPQTAYPARLPSTSPPATSTAYAVGPVRATTDFKALPPGVQGEGASLEGSQSKSGSSSGSKKSTGKDKQHPNETGMKIEELVRNSASSLRHGCRQQRWTAGLLTLLSAMAALLLAR